MCYQNTQKLTVLIFLFQFKYNFSSLCWNAQERSSLQNIPNNDGYPYIQDTLFYRYISTFFQWNVVLTTYPSRVVENDIFTVFASGYFIPTILPWGSLIIVEIKITIWILKCKKCTALISPLLYYNKMRVMGNFHNEICWSKLLKDKYISISDKEFTVNEISIASYRDWPHDKSFPLSFYRKTSAQFKCLSWQNIDTFSPTRKFSLKNQKYEVCEMIHNKRTYLFVLKICLEFIPE